MSLLVFSRLSLLKRRCVSLKRIRKIYMDCSADGEKDTQDVHHNPVMVSEVAEFLNLKKGDVLVDMTFGAGGHSSTLLREVPDLKIIALDRDPIAQGFMEDLSKKYPNQITPLLGKFTDLPLLLQKENIEDNSIDGFLFDLGCSSMQFDYPERGFSITKDGPLDMRMDGTRIPNQVTAADVIANASEKELIQIFKIYGEEKKAKKIARAILTARYTFKPIKTTTHLSDIVEAVCGDNVRHDKLQRVTKTATKVFQALRIFVNDEMNELYHGIHIAHKYLKLDGRAVVLSFHSLEDKIVKNHFTNRDDVNLSNISNFKLKHYSQGFEEEVINNVRKEKWKVINKHVVCPSEMEVFTNPRSRSAKLRAAAKVS